MDWRVIKGYEGYYKIYKNGTIEGIERKIPLINNSFRTIAKRTIKPRINNYGYLSVRLNKDGKTKTHFIHRLLADTFIENPQNLPQVNHLNGNKLDNSLSNLEWVNASTNSKHAYETGLNSNKGEDHVFSVSVFDRRANLLFPTIKAFAQYHKLPYSTARNALNGNIAVPKRSFISLDDIVKSKNCYYA